MVDKQTGGAQRFTSACQEALWRSIPVYLGMSTIAIAQPMLDLYGKNLPVFSAAKVSRYEIAVFGLIVVLLPTLFASFTEFITRLITPRSGVYVRRGFVGVFGAFFILTTLRQMGVNALVVVVALTALATYGLVWLFIRKPWAKTFMSYLAIAAPLVAGLFVINTRQILIPGQLPIASINSDVVADSTKPPVVLLVIDEAPLYSLLDAQGNINAKRYPNLAQLSQEATWHRNATAVSNWTAQAVPSIFTSLLPKRGDLPISSVHPKNIFTALGNDYPLNVYEPITSLCPSSVCKSVVPVGERWNNARFRGFLKDALVVFGHRVLPSSLRDNLPSIDQGWGGFAGGNTTEPGDNEDERMSVLRAYGVLGPVYQANLLNELLQRMSSATSPEAYVAHLLVPHRPWKATPDERLYDVFSPDIPDDLIPTDLDQRRTMYQRYLLQMAMVDTAIGNMMTSMKQSGVWDKSLVIIAADHGLTFEPGFKARRAVFDNKDITDDLYRVPMFVKLPQQKVGETTNCTVSVLDILPTILSVTKIDTDWTFDGRDISSACPDDVSRPITSTEAQGTFTNSIDVLFERSLAYDSLVTREGGTDRIAAVGASANLIGRPIEGSNDDSGVQWWATYALSQLSNISTQRGATVPVQVKGTLRLHQRMPPGAEGIITIDGVAAGVVTEIGGAEGEISFDAIVDYSLFTGGSHEIGLVINFDGSGTDLRQAPAVTR